MTAGTRRRCHPASDGRRYTTQPMATAEVSAVRWLMGFSIAAGALAWLAQGPAAATSQSAAATPAVLFLDEFSGRTLDRSMWNVIVTGETVNDEQQAYVDSAETLTLVGGDAAQGAVNGALADPEPLQARIQDAAGQDVRFHLWTDRHARQVRLQVRHGRGPREAECRCRTVARVLDPRKWTLARHRRNGHPRERRRSDLDQFRASRSRLLWRRRPGRATRTFSRDTASPTGTSIP